MIDHRSQKYDDLMVLSNETADQTPSFQKLSNTKWNQVYNTKFVSDHGALFLAIDRIAFGTSDLPTIANIDDYLPFYIEKGDQSVIQDLTIESPDWIQYSNSENSLVPNGTNPQDRNGIPISASVKQAFAEIIRPQSKIQISLYFMVIVIIFNLLKLGIMSWVFFTDKRTYIVTCGDALASFLKHPDPVTRNKCMYGKEEMLYCLGYVPYDANGEENYVENNLSSTLAGMWMPQPRRYIAFLSQDRQVFFGLLWVYPSSLAEIN